MPHSKSYNLSSSNMSYQQLKYLQRKLQISTPQEIIKNDGYLTSTPTINDNLALLYLISLID